MTAFGMDAQRFFECWNSMNFKIKNTVFWDVTSCSLLNVYMLHPFTGSKHNRSNQRARALLTVSCLLVILLERDERVIKRIRRLSVLGCKQRARRVPSPPVRSSNKFQHAPLTVSVVIESAVNILSGHAVA
jgi:hypothetical protein